MNTKKIILLLKKAYGEKQWNWHTQQTPFQILIGTVLSQRTKDANTDKAARRLFKTYPTPYALASAPLKEIENLIRPSGFYKVKAKRIKKIAKIIAEKHNGRVPKRIEELLKLPGVGRKTANCVLVFGFKLPAIPVDTHVHRIANRIGIVNTKRPEDTEDALMRIIPKRYWLLVNELFVRHGQSICLPRKPKCNECNIKDYCNYYKRGVYD